MVRGLGSRSNNTAMTLLGGYSGVLQCDGYEAYDQFEEVRGITLVACWVHARSKFFESQKEDNRLASEALVYIKKIYAVEEDADAADDAIRPLVLGRKNWLFCGNDASAYRAPSSTR